MTAAMVAEVRVLPMEMVFYLAMFLAGVLVALALFPKGGSGD